MGEGDPFQVLKPLLKQTNVFHYSTAHLIRYRFWLMIRKNTRLWRARSTKEAVVCRAIMKRLQWVTLSYISWPWAVQSGHVAYILLMQHIRKGSLAKYPCHSLSFTDTHTALSPSLSTSMPPSQPLRFPKFNPRSNNCTAALWILPLSNEITAFVHIVRRYGDNSINVWNMLNWQVQGAHPFLLLFRVEKEEGKTIRPWSESKWWLTVAYLWWWLVMLSSWRGLTFMKRRRKVSWDKCPKRSLILRWITQLFIAFAS